MSGTLIYLIGPSGSGKDSLLQAAAPALTARGCRIARRVITRSAEAMGEDALAVTLEQFDALQAQGAFALSWRANGLAYGLPKQIDAWLADGDDVLVNGSRAHLGAAQEKYPGLLVVLLRVEDAVLRQRLLARGREGVEDIEARLGRNAQFQAELAAWARSSLKLHVLDNSGPLAHTVTQLLGVLGDAHVAAASIQR
ncbi:MAG TPA: phosphonate metabolism protein/1,5-bisphosphokinase (PRPP-forming) PhnN [Pseudomonas sp.]|nr:phosphonate metabolism protein/1,5-bisphosphokinase (PRPP-forming) PhnN [Pseudomonas sp.]